MVWAIDHAPQIWQTHAALGQLYRDTDRIDQSRQHYQAARERIELLRRTTKDARLRAGLENSLRMRDVLERAAES